jgi:hypothetical protein
MGGAPSATSQLPRLDAFDQEFGGDPVAILRARRRRFGTRPIIGLLLGLLIIGVPVLAWFNADELRASMQLASLPASASRDAPDEQVERLMREIDALKQEVSDLTKAHQQAAEHIASLQAAEQEARSSPPPAYWYSDPAALSFVGMTAPRTAVGAPAVRRAATARPEGRDLGRRDGNGEPLSLEAPQ